MTETAPGATTLPAARSRDKAGSSGLPHFFTDVRVADPLDPAPGPLRPATVGEIQIKGPNVIHQYWNRPEASADSYTADGWFKSGDMGYKDPDGFVFISDRLKDMIISGGENIYPAEVEQAIAELDAVGSVAVIGVPDEKWGEVPRAVVLLREGARLTEERAARPPGGPAGEVQDPQVRRLRGRDAPDSERQDPQGGPSEAGARPRLNHVETAAPVRGLRW